MVTYTQSLPCECVNFIYLYNRVASEHQRCKKESEINENLRQISGCIVELNSLIIIRKGIVFELVAATFKAVYLFKGAFANRSDKIRRSGIAFSFSQIIEIIFRRMNHIAWSCRHFDMFIWFLTSEQCSGVSVCQSVGLAISVMEFFVRS